MNKNDHPINVLSVVAHWGGGFENVEHQVLYRTVQHLKFRGLLSIWPDRAIDHHHIHENNSRYDSEDSGKADKKCFILHVCLKYLFWLSGRLGEIDFFYPNEIRIFQDLFSGRRSFSATS